MTDPTSLEFWQVLPAFYMDDGSINYLGDWEQHTIGYWIRNEIAPDMGLNIDAFSKAFHSTILTDLGQNSTQNLLTRPSGVTYLLSYLNTTDGQQGGGGYWKIPGLPAKAAKELNTTMLTPSTAYDQLKDYMGPLGTREPTFFFQYTCSVPKRKSAVSLFVTILVADLVLLQASWTILSWTAAYFLRREPMMNYCEACYAQEHKAAQGSAYELLKHSRTHSKSAPSADEEAPSEFGSIDTGDPGQRRPTSLLKSTP